MTKNQLFILYKIHLCNRKRLIMKLKCSGQVSLNTTNIRLIVDSQR